MTTQLETKGYIASPEDIEQLTQDVLDAGEHQTQSRSTYLRALVATSQQELGIPVGRRKSVPPVMTEAETKRQLEAVESVNARFYDAVLKAVQARPILEDERGKDRKAVYSARATFARTAKSTLRSWVNSGNNMLTLVPDKVTKYALAAEITRKPAPERAPTLKFLQGLATKLLDRIKAAKSPEESIRLLEGVINQLVTGLMDLGAETTTKMEEALREGKLLQTQTGIVFATRAEPERKPPVRARPRAQAQQEAAAA